ncbi:MAG: superoxide dismutase [Alphaproteobacteria bacterium CG_4_10_14_0_8_um_filter_53_9]|nr:MAG: superoxide dismutase [Alphaproteobacteria bacterium CG_4_10_14_0_8_um_filter_53_9]
MVIYEAQAQFKPQGLVGISDKQIDEHWKLYEGYCKQSNMLKSELKAMREGGEGGSLLYADRRRRLAFEMCGMLVHDYYFANLKAGVARDVAKEFTALVAEKYGSFEAWLADFKACGATRGVGHAICYFDPMTGDINNHFIELHNDGHMPGFACLLSMDVWEHAFLLDYLPSERAKYIDMFIENVNWEVVEQRTQDAKAKKASLRF